MDDNSQPSSQTDAGLLDDATVEDNTQGQPANPQKVEIDHKAAAPQDESKPAERPDYLPENFWNAEKGEADLEAMSKSWMDLRKQISQGKHKAPTDGKYDESVFSTVPEDDPLRQHVVNWAKEFGVSQLAFDKLVGKVMEMAGEQEQETHTSVEAERKALGPNADAVIRGMTDWARGLVNKGIWGKDDFEEFKYMAGTAKGMRALMKVREAYEGTRIPTNTGPVDGAPSKDELYAMVADPKYQSDPAYRQKVEKMFAATFS